LSTISGAREAVCNTSPIQYLYQVGFLSLLEEFYARILIPPAVAAELEQGRRRGIDLPDIGPLPWVKIQAPEGLDRAPVVTDLGGGEKEVLALGLQIPGAVIILDERLARPYAGSLKLTFTGTLGILLRENRKVEYPRLRQCLQN
jgi:uncharacterized protein